MAAENIESLFKGAVSLPPSLTTEHLRIMAEVSGGFNIVPDYDLAAKTLQDLNSTGGQAGIQAGYTNMSTKSIHYNPVLFEGVPQLGIKPVENPAGFFYHEIGHHTKEARQFQDMMLNSLGDEPDVIPDAYKGDPASEARFFQAVQSHLQNGLADKWLESFMGRRPYYTVRNNISSFHIEGGGRESLKMYSKPEQLMQVLVGEDMYGSKKPVAELIDPDVFEAFQRLKKSKAVEAIDNRVAFENYFSSELDKRSTIERKFAAYEQAFLPEYIKLMEAELKERKQARQLGMGGSADNAVPLTKEEERELVDHLLNQLIEAGKEYTSHAPSPEEQEVLQDKIKQIKDALEKRQREGQQPQGPKPEPQKKSGEENIRNLAEELQRQERERRMRGLAESMKVRQKSVESWNRIKEKYRSEIDSTAAFLSEVFLDDRRKRLEYLRREGEIIPGLEYETISALISGELDPDTKMITVRNPEFLETELECVNDTSGSMSGERLEKSIDLEVILVEAFKKVREDLAGEDLLLEDEQPFRVGVIKFAASPERVTKLEEPLSDKKELIIIDKVSKSGGGTDETEAIQEVYKGLTLGKGNVIKMIIVLSDGEGNKEGVAPIIRQVEEDDQVIFLIVAMGKTLEEGDDVAESYIAPLRDKNKNVFGITAVEPAEVLPQVLDFIKKQVEQRRQF